MLWGTRTRRRAGMQQPQGITLINMSPEEYFSRQREEFKAVAEEVLKELLRRVELGPTMTTKDVCRLTGMSPRKLFDLREQGRIPYYQDGRSIVFKTEDVLAFIEEGEVPARSRRPAA